MIEQASKHKFHLFAKGSGKLLGTHPTKAAALKQEAAIEISKKGGGKKSPFPFKKGGK